MSGKCRCGFAPRQLRGSNYFGSPNAWVIQSACHDRGACSFGNRSCHADAEARVRQIHSASNPSILPFYLEPVLLRVPPAAVFVTERRALLNHLLAALSLLSKA